MFRDPLISTLIAASCLTQLTFSSPTPSITQAPISPTLPPAALADLRRHWKRDPLSLPSIDWSGLNPTSLLPWLFGDGTTVVPTATPTGGGGGTAGYGGGQCSTYNIPGGSVATLCPTGASSNPNGGGGGIGTGIGATAGVSAGGATAGVSGPGGSAGAGATAGQGAGAAASGVITSFTSVSPTPTNNNAAAATRSGNQAPMPSRGSYLNIVIVIPVIVLGAAL